MAGHFVRDRRRARLLFYRCPTACSCVPARRGFCLCVGLDHDFCRHDLRPGRLRPRPGLHLHVPMAAASGRDLGSGSLHRQLSRLSREQRTSAKKAIELRSRGEPAGDCVACNMCVNVCPIGIDIREGPNFACINCGLCVDACDNVMTSLSRPRGLIDYESWNNIERERKGEARVSQMIRPKTVALTGACVALAAGMAIMFANRTNGAISVQHDRSPVSVMLSDGSVRNGY